MYLTICYILMQIHLKLQLYGLIWNILIWYLFSNAFSKWKEEVIYKESRWIFAKCITPYCEISFSLSLTNMYWKNETTFGFCFIIISLSDDVRMVLDKFDNVLWWAFGPFWRFVINTFGTFCRICCVSIWLLRLLLLFTQWWSNNNNNIKIGWGLVPLMHFRIEKSLIGCLIGVDELWYFKKLYFLMFILIIGLWLVLVSLLFLWWFRSRLRLTTGWFVLRTKVTSFIYTKQQNTLSIYLLSQTLFEQWFKNLARGWRLGIYFCWKLFYYFYFNFYFIHD